MLKYILSLLIKMTQLLKSLVHVGCTSQGGSRGLGAFSRCVAQQEMFFGEVSVAFFNGSDQMVYPNMGVAPKFHGVSMCIMISRIKWP